MGTGAAAFRLIGTAPAPPSCSIITSLTIFTTCWPGETLASTSWPTARSRTLAMKSLHHGQRHVGVQQREADLAQRVVDVGLAQRAAAAQPVEDAGEFA